MINKKRVFLFGVGLLILFVTISFFSNNKHNDNNNLSNTEIEHEMQAERTVQTSPLNEKVYDKDIKTVQKQVSNLKVGAIEIDNYAVNKTKLLNNDATIDIPLSTISVISSLPQNIQDKVLVIAENNSVYMTKKQDDKLLIVTDNPQNIRHSIEFIEISIKNGHQIKTTLGYNDKIKDSDNDIWEYDNTTKQPIRHSKYNSDGDIEFVETWNYDNNPVKYEMKDSEGHVLSMRKEILDDNTNLRIEHLVYDKSGNTKINVSAVYDGADVKRFTYYNADKPSDGGSVFAEYNEGFKTKETIYSNDLKVENYYTAQYKNGEREEIVIWDKNNKEIQKLISTNEAEVL